jgi:hypothetical protein
MHIDALQQHVRSRDAVAIAANRIIRKFMCASGAFHDAHAAQRHVQALGRGHTSIEHATYHAAISERHTDFFAKQ